MAKHDYSGALAENLNAVTINSKMPYVWNGVGDSYERLRQYEKASASYQEALRLNPRDAYSKNGQALIALAKGDFTAALEATRAAIALSRSGDYAFITLGDIQTRQSAYNDAVEAYRQAIVLNPRSAEAWDGLGKAYVWQGDYANALDAYEQGLKEQPRNWRLALGRADVLLRKEIARQSEGNFTDIVPEYERITSLADGSAIAAWLRLAVIFATYEGKIESAMASSSKALAVYDSSWARHAHPDADLLEFKALALLLNANEKQGLDCAQSARHALPTVGHFDSERVGAYELLTDVLPGFDSYLRAVGVA
jgi:tetratricopeptide (TPR) repeat protein